MNYSKIYDSIILRAQTRVLEGYKEIHHILPKCMGGSDIPSNLVALTAEEHYIAHMLLVRIYPNNPKLVFAANMMANRNNKSYGWIKRRFSDAIKLQNKGQQLTEEQKQKMRAALKGRKKNEDWKAKIGHSHTKKLEYKGEEYFGFEDLKQKTGVTYHLYNKYYLKGVDPEPFINNNTYAIIATSRLPTNRPCLGKKWYHNETEEKLYLAGTEPSGWLKGRLPGRQDGHKNPNYKGAKKES